MRKKLIAAIAMTLLLFFVALGVADDGTAQELPVWVEPLTTVVIALITIFGSTISALFIKGRIKAATYIHEKVKNDAIAKILDTVNATAWTVAEGLYEDTVRDIKKGRSDGKLTKDEIASLKTESVKRMKSRLSKASLDALKKAGYEDVESLLADSVALRAQLSKERNNQYLKSLAGGKTTGTGGAVKPQKEEGK